MELSTIRAKFKQVTQWEPHIFQEEAWKQIQKGLNIIIAAGTGSGKTEAALLPAIESEKRIIVLYPTKALLQDQLARVANLWCRTKGGTLQDAEQHIAVDTGDEDDISYYHADIILTNLDKFLYRMFGYGKKRFSYLFPYRIAGNNIRPTLLIFDEAHAYEDVIFSHFWFALKKMTYEHCVQTVLMSATLPSNFIEALRDEHRQYFPRPDSEGDFFTVVEDKEIRTGQVFYNGFLPSVDKVIDLAWQEYKNGKRVIMVVRRVVKSDDEDMTGNSLHEIWERLLERASDNELAHRDGIKVAGSVLTYHGHQMSSYRQLALERLKELDEQKQPYLLLTTSAMEVGVDVSCEIMITDLCESDSFVQRIGRCARRKGEIGHIYVIDANSTPPRTKKLRDYLKNLTIGIEFDSRLKIDLNQMNQLPQLDSVHLRLEYVQDLSLYRYIYDFVQENRQIWEKGILVTREWEPCLPLVRSEKREGKNYIGGITEQEFWRGKEIKEKVLLPVSAAASIAPFCAWIFEAFNVEFHHPQRVPVGGKEQRTLKETLMEAGYSAGDKDNESKPQYAPGFPLILLLGDQVGGEVFKDDNTGFAYHRQFVRPEGIPKPPPSLKPKMVKLQRSKGQVRLPLYWLEPVEGEETL